jgi:hypothetical protein
MTYRGSGWARAFANAVITPATSHSQGVCWTVRAATQAESTRRGRESRGALTCQQCCPSIAGQRCTSGTAQPRKEKDAQLALHNRGLGSRLPHTLLTTHLLVVSATALQAVCREWNVRSRLRHCRLVSRAVSHYF